MATHITSSHTHTHTHLPTAQKTRIILGDLKIGMNKESAVRALAPDGKERLDASCNLRRLCAEIALGCVRACVRAFFHSSHPSGEGAGMGMSLWID
jgi:hypothetical protein